MLTTLSASPTRGQSPALLAKAGIGRLPRPLLSPLWPPEVWLSWTWGRAEVQQGQPGTSPLEQGLKAWRGTRLESAPRSSPSASSSSSASSRNRHIPKELWERSLSSSP